MICGVISGGPSSAIPPELLAPPELTTVQTGEWVRCHVASKKEGLPSLSMRAYLVYVLVCARITLSYARYLLGFVTNLFVDLCPMPGASTQKIQSSAILVRTAAEYTWYYKMCVRSKCVPVPQYSVLYVVCVP